MLKQFISGGGFLGGVLSLARRGSYPSQILFSCHFAGVLAVHLSLRKRLRRAQRTLPRRGIPRLLER